MDAQQDRRSVVDLMTRVVNDVVGLFQTELRLARAELNDKASQIASGGILIGSALVLVIAGLVVTLMGIVRWLAIAGMPEEWGLLLVGLLALALGGILVSLGIRHFKSTNLVPDRSIGQIRADVATVRNHIT